MSVKARELLHGDRIVRAAAWHDVITSLTRLGADNERVQVAGDAFGQGFDVDDVVLVERSVSFTREELVSLVDDIASDSRWSGEAAGESVVRLLEGRRVPA